MEIILSKSIISKNILAFFMKILIGSVAAIMLASGLFFAFHLPRTNNVQPMAAVNVSATVPEKGQAPRAEVLKTLQAPGDIEPQSQLGKIPDEVRGIYITGWVAGSPNLMVKVMAFIKREKINAVVLDIKDYSGYLSYRTTVAEAEKSGAHKELRYRYPNKLIKLFHDNGVYVIGRVTIFQDTILAKAHPEWAMKNKSNGALWKDRKGLSWMDPATKEVWDYNIAISNDAYARGFDEINFDYVRFASDGDVNGIAYPNWDGTTPKSEVIAKFFAYLRSHLPDRVISADLFGLASINDDDLGIGQVIEDAYKYFDYICPMIYPSHYASGFLGYKNPAAHPYEIIVYSMEKAVEKHRKLSLEMTGSTRKLGRLRPWLQVFDLGATYDTKRVNAQIKALKDVLGSPTSSSPYEGFLLWDPKVIYAAYKG